MELKFLGIGSAFETKLYNTSAFFIEDKKLFLIDCGETTFAQLTSQKFLIDIKEIFVAFTHTHSDHIAGIGSLANYCFSTRKKLNIIVPSKNNDGLYEDILNLLDIFSIQKHNITFLTNNEISKYFSYFNKMKFLPTNHAPELKNCYSILFKTNLGNIFYSSDSIDTKYITKYLNENLYKMYIDVTLSIPTVHLDLNILDSIVPKNYRNKVYCMHFDSHNCMQKAKNLGFNIATSVAKYLDKSITYTKYNNNLILYQCSDITFMLLQHYDILKDINKISIHLKDTTYKSASGLGSLLCYSYFVLKKSIDIYTRNTNNLNILKLVQIYGIPKESINFINEV